MTLGMSMDTFGFTLRCGENPGQKRSAILPRHMDVATATPIVTAPENDWMELQAAYIRGALLMPRSYVLWPVRSRCATGASPR